MKDTLVYIEVNGETIETTREHPFWVEGQGWTKAKFLNEGDLLRDANGNNITINRVDIVPLPENQYTIVYNLEVADFHTYYVTNELILVHNRCNVQVEKFKKFTGHSPVGEVHHGLPEQYSKPKMNVKSRTTRITKI